MKLPSHCKSIEEVRNVIDLIDEEVIALLGKRYRYVKEVTRFKEPSKESVIARERFEFVIKSRRKMAVKEGLDPDIIEKIYRDLLHYFISEELKLIGNK